MAIQGLWGSKISDPADPAVVSCIQARILEKETNSGVLGSRRGKGLLGRVVYLEEYVHL